MKATKSIIICRTDDTNRITIITDKKKGSFSEPTAMATFIKAYAGIYKAICMELYSDQKFLCSDCGLHLYFTHFSGIVLGGSKEPETLCLKCAAKFGMPQNDKPKLGLVKGDGENGG